MYNICTILIDDYRLSDKKYGLKYSAQYDTVSESGSV